MVARAQRPRFLSRIAQYCSYYGHGTDEHLPPRWPQKLDRGTRRRRRYSSSSDYVRDLVRREQEAEEKLRILRAAVEEGLASGTSDRTIEDIIADGRARRAAQSSAG
ncbi:ribbon-helix-helix domain-containing protein [Sphingobium sp. Ant17]|uniref:ribbon-helix-helix domain-containing protein n=1 Tax=Sphingobium sp. Ant17 TaxID=1461752 RepID=UPI003FA7CCDA